MIRPALALVLLLLPAAALAQSAGGPPGVPPHHDTIMAAEPLSRAQVRQMIADHGYFELSDLRRGKDGSWRCTAMVSPGKRVTVTLDENGNITQSDAPDSTRQ